MTTAIEIKQASFAYDATTALENINVTIEKGEFIGIIGPNGGGKTTLLKIILGFLKLQIGNVTIFDSPPEKMQKKMGYVPQSIYMDREFPITVIDLVLMGSISKINRLGFYYDKEKEKAFSLLKSMNLDDLHNKPIGNLSRGQFQKALILRALIGDPEILILDEPTASIDMEAEKLIFDLLLSYKGKKTILMVNHDLNTTIKNVDRGYFGPKKHKNT